VGLAGDARQVATPVYEASIILEIRPEARRISPGR
jgi:hypothetical protein